MIVKDSSMMPIEKVDLVLGILILADSVELVVRSLIFEILVIFYEVCLVVDFEEGDQGGKPKVMI